jgi:uncharacterized YigZ family protein
LENAAAELIDQRSRFIATIGRVESVEETKHFLAQVAAAHPEASHHAYAFVVGFGSSKIEGMSDAGEPSGTAGQPIMAVLRGSGLGDAMIVVTRYWGGIKLGTGGLVRAYTDAAKEVVAAVKTEVKIERARLSITVAYALYERLSRLLSAHEAAIEHEEYASDVCVVCLLPKAQVDGLLPKIRDLSAGKARVEFLI